MADHEELIAQFVEVSGCERGVAEFYLSSSNWSVEDALTNFLGTQNENETMRDDSEDEEEAGGASGTAQTEPKKPVDKFTKSTAKPKFGTLKTVNNKDSSSEEEAQAFYAGGSERSGQQVLGPPKRKNFREQLSEMFRMAQEQSQHETSPGPSNATPAVNWGQGVRLGMTESDHTVVGNPSAAKRGSGQKPVVILKLWRQGFSVDDGELRAYDDPENKEFLETVMRGEIPAELLQMGWMVNVDVEDHRTEDFKKAAPAATFRGSGHTLGSPTPNVEVSNSVASTSTASTAAVAAPFTSANESSAKEQLKVDTTTPTTTLQIRLADGSRVSAQFNLTHTIADIQQYIRNARPQYAEQNFILVSSFPTRELTDGSATIEAAGLKNASIMQRLK